jgi:hypothetical protein
MHFISLIFCTILTRSIAVPQRAFLPCCLMLVNSCLRTTPPPTQRQQS